MSSPNKALVTGAAGFVGSWLARRLLREGVEPHLVVRPGGDRWRLEGIEAPVHAVDVANSTATESLVEKTRPVWIFHLAAHGAYPAQRNFPRMVEVNLFATMNLLAAASRHGCDAFVHTGSSSEYGYVDHPPREDEPAVPRSHYAVTKLAATLHARAFAKRHGVPLTVLRLYSVYGPLEEPTRLIPTLALEGLEGRLPSLVEPEVARDFVYVDDVADAYIRAARASRSHSGKLYNVGTGRQTTVREAVSIARNALGVSEEPQFGTLANREWDTTCWVANPTRIGEDLGWKALTSFEDGFARFVIWLQEDPERLRVYRERARAAS